MSANVNAMPSHPTIQDMEADLSAMQLRLNELLAVQPFKDQHFVEISAIFNNVSYIFLYLESNSIHIDFDVLQPWKERFFNDKCLDDRLLTVLSGLSCAERDLERSREVYVEFLSAKRYKKPELSADKVEHGISIAQSVLRDIAADVTAFLDSIGITVTKQRPEAALYALASRTKSQATRRKLYRAWREVRDKRLDDFASAIDVAVRARWDEAHHQGYSTVAQRTFEKCGVSIEQVKTFLDAYVARAVQSQVELCRLIGCTRAPNGASMDDFGYYISQLYSDSMVPMLPLDGCLRFAFDAASRVLNLEFEQIDGSSDKLIKVDVWKEGRRAGRIYFDLWSEQGQDKEANFTRGLRNRTAWNTVEQIPVAHVSCRFRQADNSRQVLNFQNVHSLFHEFGHALNHLFIKQRMPNQSGLEYLPIERLEILSMWFEKWIYHREFAVYVAGTGIDPRHLAVAQEIKMLEYRRTHLDRAVTSIIDLMIHEHPDLSVKETFRRLDDRFGIDELCDLGAILPGFTWPMMQSNSGAYFAYLWGAGKSAEMFAPFLASSLADAPEAKATWEILDECFVFDHPSSPPDIESVFTFYGG